MYNPQIETFVAVAENGSFKKTSELLYISSTAVMKQINALEKRLGIFLFLRTNHGLQLTEAGKSFLQDAKYILDYSKLAIKKSQRYR
ncbi:MAG: LysR family transcriptional regulator [Anaeroplasma sp.]